jgi:hypothetical protein
MTLGYLHEPFVAGRATRKLFDGLCYLIIRVGPILLFANSRNDQALYPLQPVGTRHIRRLAAFSITLTLRRLSCCSNKADGAQMWKRHGKERASIDTKSIDTTTRTAEKARVCVHSLVLALVLQELVVHRVARTRPVNMPQLDAPPAYSIRKTRMGLSRRAKLPRFSLFSRSAKVAAFLRPQTITPPRLFWRLIRLWKLDVF